VLRFLEGEGPQSAIGSCGDGFAAFGSPYRSLRPSPERFEDHGSRVLVLGRLVGASRLAEGDLDVPVAWVWTVRAGRVVAMQAFRDERAAREAIASP
jgi:ketosteroid isomerase-like protein